MLSTLRGDNLLCTELIAQKAIKNLSCLASENVINELFIYIISLSSYRTKSSTNYKENHYQVFVKYSELRVSAAKLHVIKRAVSRAVIRL
jgi:hypothetical protein